MNSGVTMLKYNYLYLSKAKWAQTLISEWAFAWRAASRFVAGETSGQALEIAAQLNAAGYRIALDPLGELSDTAEAARAAAEEIIHLIEKIHHNQIDSYVSIKLTQLGLIFNEPLCYQLLEKIIDAARGTGVFIRVDMEDSSTTDQAIQITSWMHSIYPNVGVVIQSYLYRSVDDLTVLLKDQIPIRMVKGAYSESKEIAFSKKSEVDKNFDLLSQIILHSARSDALIRSTRLVPPLLALATHDENRIDTLLAYAAKHGFSKQAFEIQMLYGIRRDLQQKYRQMGYPVRIYIPYGTHWYPYFMRRLAERPANVWFFISNFLKH
jgi:proline dehydrogenase